MTKSVTELLETRLGRVLSASSFASTLLLAAGLALALARPAIDPERYLLRSGLIILLAGPVARVALSAITYLRAREWLYAALAATVFLVLLASTVVALQTGG